MYKTLFAFCIGATVICGLALTNQTLSKNKVQDHSSAVSRSDGLAGHLPYMFLFQHLNQLSEQANNQRRLGKDGSGFQRRFKNAFDIDDEQFEKINEIALQCESETAELDKKAKAITEAFWAQYPPGKVPEGVIIPPPPAELIALQEMRSGAILRARDQMKEVLGDQEFARFDETVKVRLTPSIDRIP